MYKYLRIEKNSPTEKNKNFYQGISGFGISNKFILMSK